MQAIDPLAFIPYWKWSSNRAVPAWIAAFKPTVIVPAAPGMPGMPGQPQKTVHVSRAPHLPSGLPTAAQINALDANTSLPYTQFTGLLEGYHNTVHNWVGGTMANITISPADPLFWMHHGEIDRIWSVWEANPGNAGKKPTLAGADAVMDPWPENFSALLSIAALGYSYV
jgi:tyrosinase